MKHLTVGVSDWFRQSIGAYCRHEVFIFPRNFGLKWPAYLIHVAYYTQDFMVIILETPEAAV